MKNMLRKVLVMSLSCLLFFGMAIPTFAAEYDMDEIAEGQQITLYLGDTITAFDEPANAHYYFTVLDGVGGHIGDPDNKNQPNVFINEFQSMHGVKEQVYLGTGSTYTAYCSIPGFYSYTVERRAAKDNSGILDADGNSISYVDLTLVGNPNPITYTIKYHANGGSGTIEPQQWVYAERGKALSDGSGFSREGYTLVGWTPSAEGDVNKDGAIDENDGIVIGKLGESLDLGPDANIAREIPSYAAETSLDGSADVTLYAVWEENTVGVAPGGEAEPAPPETPAQPATPAAPETTANTNTTPNTGDTNSLLPAVSTMILLGAFSILLYKKSRA